MGKTRIYEDTGSRIVSALSSLMDEMPVSKITITKVCERAQLNRSTFYDHFASLEEVRALVNKDLIKEFSGILESEHSICEELFRKVFELIENNMEFFRNYYSNDNQLDFESPFMSCYEECQGISGVYVARFWDSGLNAAIKTWLIKFPNRSAASMERLFGYHLDNKQ